jgi:hypothetical protein
LKWRKKDASSTRGGIAICGGALYIGKYVPASVKLCVGDL